MFNTYEFQRLIELRKERKEKRLKYTWQFYSYKETQKYKPFFKRLPSFKTDQINVCCQ
jgi:hypothetical protein